MLRAFGHAVSLDGYSGKKYDYSKMKQQYDFE